MQSVNFVLLLFFAVLCCAYIAALLLKRELPTPEMGERAYNIALAFIILLAVAVRVYRFGAVPAGFNQDGAMAAVDAKALADYGTDRYGMRWPVHLTAWGYGQMSALLSYLMIPFIKLFGLGSVTARLPLLLVSLGGLACLYLFSKDTFGKGAALAVLFFAAVDPWHIIQSRWALDCNLFPHFFMAGVYFLSRGAGGRMRFIALSMLMFGLCMYCYGVSIYTVPLFLVAMCIYLLAAKRIKPVNALAAMAVYLLVAWPFIAVMVINFFKLQTVETALFTLPYFPDSVRSNDILFFSPELWTQLTANVKTLFDKVVLQKSDLPWNEVIGFGTVYLFSMPLAAAGLAELFRGIRKSAGRVSLLMFLLTGIFAGIATNGVNINRVNLIFYPVIVLCGVGLWWCMSLLRRFRWLVPAVYLAVFALFCRSYFTDYADTMAYYFYADFGAAVSSVKDDDAGKMYITADTQYEGASAVSEILTLFYHQTDAEYYQGKTPDGETPFAEKYVFQSMKYVAIDPKEDAVYVVRASDLPLFDDSRFDFESFGSYYVVRAEQ